VKASLTTKRQLDAMQPSFRGEQDWPRVDSGGLGLVQVLSNENSLNGVEPHQPYPYLRLKGALGNPLTAM
jgi:hypothetical protein